MSIESQTSNGSELEELKNRFAEWRQHRKRGARVPKELWDSAVGLSSKHSVSEISRILRIDYPKLKRRVEALRHKSEKGIVSPATFVEVGTTQPTTDVVCVVEFENSAGVKLRMLFRKGSDLDFAALSKAFWRHDG